MVLVRWEGGLSCLYFHGVIMTPENCQVCLLYRRRFHTFLKRGGPSLHLLCCFLLFAFFWRYVLVPVHIYFFLLCCFHSLATIIYVTLRKYISAGLYLPLLIHLHPPLPTPTTPQPHNPVRAPLFHPAVTVIPGFQDLDKHQHIHLFSTTTERTL